jgi:hypothetical protein
VVEQFTDSLKAYKIRTIRRVTGTLAVAAGQFRGIAYEPPANQVRNLRELLPLLNAAPPRCSQ